MDSPREQAAKKLDDACRMLRAKNMDQGAARLKRADELADQVDFLTLDRLVDPGQTVEEFAAKLNRRIHQLHSARNALAVAPLLVTWLALAWASIEYSKELAHYPGRVTKPFLLLWQQHFGHSLIPTFAQFGIADLVLLGVVFASTIGVHGVEVRLVKQQTKMAELIDSAMGDLALAISSGLVRNPVTAHDWAEATQRVIGLAMEQTERMAEEGRKTLEKASDDLKAANDDQREVVNTYRELVNTFSEEINKALSNVQEEHQQFMLRTADQVLKIIEQQMDPLLGKFGGLVTQFGEHHETYRDGVAKLTEGVSKMSLSAETLAASAADHAKVGVEIGANLAKVAESQRDFADQVTKNVSSMESSARAMESTAETLRTDVISELKGFTDNVKTASRDLKSVNGSLKSTSSALESSTEALKASSDSLAKVTREMRSAAATLSSSIRVGLLRRIFRSRRHAGT